jgi:hypothetical protein
MTLPFNTAGQSTAENRPATGAPPELVTIPNAALTTL